MFNEYIRRIHLAQDYIRRNCELDINLADLANAAHFSPFHFHRVFTEYQQETPNDYLRRIRVERAAQLLYKDPPLPMLTVALQCGFKSQSSFSRAFRVHFGMTASEWRKGDFWQHNGANWRWQDSKSHQTSSNADRLQSCRFLEREEEMLAALRGERPKQILDIRFETRPAMRRAYFWRNCVAPYQVIDFWLEVLAWGQEQGLLTPESIGVSRSLDNANITGVELTRYEAGFIVDADFKSRRDVIVDDLAGGQFIVMDFEGQLTDEALAIEYLFGHWIDHSEWEVMGQDGYLLIPYSNFGKEIHPQMILRDQWYFSVRKRRR